MSSLVTAELGTKENPHNMLPKICDRIVGHWYLYGGKAPEGLRKWEKTKSGQYKLRNLKHFEKEDTNYRCERARRARKRYKDNGLRWDGKQLLSKEQKKTNAIYPNDPFKTCVRKKIQACYKRSEKTNRICSLTEEYIWKLWEKQKGICAISGQKMSWNMKKKDTKQKWGCNKCLSIDRIDSINGNYVEGEIQLVCTIVNIMKNQYPQEIFIKWCNFCSNNE